jgi:hypothetical protein
MDGVNGGGGFEPVESMAKKRLAGERKELLFFLPRKTAPFAGGDNQSSGFHWFKKTRGSRAPGFKDSRKHGLLSVYSFRDTS